jgi:hypothetical protein
MLVYASSQKQRDFKVFQPFDPSSTFANRQLKMPGLSPALMKYLTTSDLLAANTTIVLV